MNDVCLWDASVGNCSVYGDEDWVYCEGLSEEENVDVEFPSDGRSDVDWRDVDDS